MVWVVVQSVSTATVKAGRAEEGAHACAAIAAIANTVPPFLSHCGFVDLPVNLIGNERLRIDLELYYDTDNARIWLEE